MSSEAQSNLFNKLLEERKFPDGTDKTALKAQFEGLSQDAASDWIRKRWGCQRWAPLRATIPRPPSRPLTTHPVPTRAGWDPK